uniref:SFRICE_000368 n=1 Tax=Spodoptera frugiperda TaxID=7108 RepID=A0A2H1VFI3_SPOFR
MYEAKFLSLACLRRANSELRVRVVTSRRFVCAWRYGSPSLSASSKHVPRALADQLTLVFPLQGKGLSTLLPIFYAKRTRAEPWAEASVKSNINT